MIQYIETEPDGRMVAIFEINLPAEVPTPTVGGNLIVANPNPLIGWPAKDHEKAYFVGGLLSLVDARTLAATCASAYAKCFTDINAVVWDAVGNMTEEYKDALAEARSYKANGYAGAAPEMVACYADKETQTGAWATDDIIARANAFDAAKKAMRTQRMARQKEMKAATTLAQLDAAGAAWNGFIAQLRAQLSLPGVQ